MIFPDISPFLVPCEISNFSVGRGSAELADRAVRGMLVAARASGRFFGNRKRVGFQGKMWENPVNPIFFMGKIWKNLGTYGKIHENPLEIKCKPHFMGLNGHIFGGSTLQTRTN